MIEKMPTRYLFVLVLIFLFSNNLFAQTDSTKRKLVETLCKHIYSTYVSAELAKEMSDSIRLKFSNGGYDSLLNLDEFTYEITKDLRKISHDNHITVTPPHRKYVDYQYDYKYDSHSYKKLLKIQKRNNRKYKRFMEKYKRRTNKDNYSYGEIKIIPGNIGYLEIKDFHSTSFKNKENRNRIKIESVIGFLRNTNSIIIDLRGNLGGYVKEAARFCSYFTKTSKMYFISCKSFARWDSSGTEKEYTFIKKEFTSNRITNYDTKAKKLFVLISKRTFSAAELTTYKIKQFAPATTIIGEKTIGGGNGHYGGHEDKYFSAIIPSVKVYDELKENYTLEAKGITPDIITSADSAFPIAYKYALIPNIDTSQSKTKYFKQDKIKVSSKEFFLKKNYPDYVGNYKKISVTIENKRLCMLYDGFEKIILKPDGVDYFLATDFEFVKFVRDANNTIKEILLKHEDGYLESFRRQ